MSIIYFLALLGLSTINVDGFITIAPRQPLIYQQQYATSTWKFQQQQQQQTTTTTLWMTSTNNNDNDSTNNEQQEQQQHQQRKEDSQEKNESKLNQKEEEEEEWYPRDPAETTPQLLAGLWFQIAQAGSMSKGESMTVIYPLMEEKLNQQPPTYISNIMAHLDYCKDVCDHFGISTTLIPYIDSTTKKIIGFTSKSYRNPKAFNILLDNSNDDDDNNNNNENDNNEFKFDYDPMWDDGTDYDNLYKGVDDDDEMIKDPYPEIINKIPEDDETIINVTKKWVQSVISDMGVCPFSPSATQAGLPVGPVFYDVTRVSTVEDMYVKYWEEVTRLEQQKEYDLSTTLLIAPEFFMDNVELFETFSNSLTQPLSALGVEDLIQLVFFHPQWFFRDGSDRAGGNDQAAANYARRSPWPMINILRTNQVRAAQRGIPTGLVYKQNEKTLSQIGVNQLETMLRLRDWSKLSNYKVNRKEIDALKIAQTVQETGQIKDIDRNLANDATPVANRVVDRRQVEEGNLVKVLIQALEKRLGKSEGSHGPTVLSGPETSAASMATEYLVQALEEVISSNKIQSSDKGSTQSLDNLSTTEPDPSLMTEIDAARQAKMNEARRMLMEDITGEEQQVGFEGSDRGSELSDVLFGKGGVDARTDDDIDFDAFTNFQNN